MKLKDSDKIILLLLLGIAVCALSIVYIAKPNYETKQTLDGEITQLQVRLSELQQKAANRETYEREIVEYNEKFDEILNRFPADLNQEISIMFLQGIKDSNEFSVKTLELGEKTPFYTLMSDNVDATPVSADGTAANTTTTEATSTEVATTETATLTESTDVVDENALTCYKADFPMEYYGSYASLKDVVAYIDNYADRMTVDELTIKYEGENIYAGNILMSCYSIEGQDRPERSLDMNEVEIGVDNIFEGANGAGASTSSSLNKYDDKDGAAIESTYDFYAMLNPASSDVSAKVVGQNGTGKEASVISNSDNTVSTLAYEFYETDGKIYCKYTLDGDQSYEAEVTSAEDIKLLIQSSEKKNDDDKAGVKITINNSTSMPVYVKVAGDDAVSPRVTISKTGLVKVYQ